MDVQTLINCKNLVCRKRREKIEGVVKEEESKQVLLARLGGEKKLKREKV